MLREKFGESPGRLSEVEAWMREFTHLVTRLEAGQKQDIPLSGFSSRDGTTFNLRFSRPRAVHASASDLTGKKFDAQVAWK